MYGQFKRFLSKTFLAGLSSTLALLTFSSALQAQDGGDVEELVVTGFRGSLEQSLNVKRDSANAVDSIHAEDIADFPDLNLAESLQRIPGVAISRAAGEGRQVTVRGLGAQFTTVRINGMEALSTGGFTDALGGANRGRNFDFNAFDSDVFRSLTIHKSMAAELEEGSLGSNVALQTARPFDYDGFTLAATGQFGYNDRSEEWDPRGSFLISNTFADDTFGALLAISTSTRNTADEGSSTVRWSNVEDFGSADGIPLPAGPVRTDHEVNQAWHPRIPRYDSYVQETERLGVNAALQFRPSDSTEVSLDVLISNAEVTRDETFMQIALNNGGAVGGTDISNYIIRNNGEAPSDGAIVYAELTNARLLSEARHDELSVDFTQYVLSFNHEFSDRLRMNASIGQAESEFDNPVQRYVILQKNGSVIYDMRGGEGADFDFGPESTDPDGWTVNGIRKRAPQSLNTIDQIQVNLEFDLNDSWSVEGGVSQKTYEYEQSEGRMASEGNNGITGIISSDFLKNYDAGPLGSWVTPNHDEFNEVFDFYSNSGIFEVSTDNRIVDTMAVEEETLSAYLQLNFDLELGVPVRGNVGFRNFNTEQTSTGLTSATTSATANVEYDDTLPALNLVAELQEDLLLRLGYADVIARPGLAGLRPAATVSVSGSNRTVNGNNPGVGPTEATTYDLGLEWYFADESLLSVAFFKKDIGSHAANITSQDTYTSTGLPLQLAIDACEAGPDGYGPNCNENLPWVINAPGKGPGGDLDGYEISYQQPFTNLPGIWSNFGVIINYTKVESDIDYVDGLVVIREDTPLINLSDETSNLTVYYEGDAFSARVSMAERSDYLTNVPGRNGTFVEYTEGTTNIDLSASYELNENIKFLFEGLNLTDEAENQRLDVTAFPTDVVSYYHQTGKQFFLGVRYTN